jgi:catechol 2,3-dioxygenase-like lactoylglutathione lyase family enzyme
MTLSIHHIAINSAQPAALAALYAKGAGFITVKEEDAIRWIAAPNCFVSLHTVASAGQCKRHEVYDPGIGHFCIQSGGADSAWDQLNDAGVTFNSRPAPLGTGVLYAYGRDSEDNLIELEGVPDEHPATPPWIAHVALVSDDLDRLADFYSRLIGRAVHREGSFSHPSFRQITGFDDVSVSAKWIMADNMVFEMWRYHNPSTHGIRTAGRGAPGYRHIGFVCDDLVTEVERLRSEGILVFPADNMAELNGVWGTDPDGNRFTLHETTKADHTLNLANLNDPKIVMRRTV